MHLTNDLSISSYSPPVIVGFISITRSGNLGTWKTRQRMKRRNIVQCNDHTVDNPDPNKSSRALERDKALDVNCLPIHDKQKGTMNSTKNPVVQSGQDGL
jgi:hypothetical protein